MQVPGATDTHKTCHVCVCNCVKLSGQDKTLTLPVLMVLFALGPLSLKNTSTRGSVFDESFVQITYKSMTPSTQPNTDTHIFSQRLTYWGTLQWRRGENALLCSLFCSSHSVGRPDGGRRYSQPGMDHCKSGRTGGMLVGGEQREERDTGEG